MHKGLWLCAAGALLAACGSHESPQQAQARMEKETESFTAAASATMKRFQGWLMAGQADSIASVFTEQGREMPPNQPAVIGRPAIKVYESQHAAMMTAKLSLRGESYMASGPLGVERGSFTFEGKAIPGAPKGVPASVHDEGKYLIHWHHVNGQWQIADMIWNSSNHSMAAAAGSATKKPAAKPATKSSTKSKTTKKK
jgi:ketosteroid isomerase-like protein